MNQGKISKYFVKKFGLKNTGKDTKSLVELFRTKIRNIDLNTSIKFEEVIQEHNISDELLEEKTKAFRNQSRVGYACFIASLLIALFSNNASIALTISVLAITITYAFIRAFRAWQIEIRDFQPITVFVTKYKEWIR